jgi:hypothetical protein
MRAVVLAMVAACGGGGGGGGGGDDAGAIDGGAADADPLAPDGEPIIVDGGGGAGARVLYQCTPFDGGLCAMDGDGGDPETLEEDGFAPRGLPDGSILFHSASYHVWRRSPGGELDDLGAGAFPRPHPDGGILFQCDGLGGGLCRMDDDGSDRDTVRATGRVPAIADDGTILYHTDGYHVVRRDPGGEEDDLGEGAFPVWTDDGDIVFQCDGLAGGLCRMEADGTGRDTLEDEGRVPSVAGDGAIVFHSDDYVITVRDAGGVDPLRAGANAVWW